MNIAMNTETVVVLNWDLKTEAIKNTFNKKLKIKKTVHY